LIPFVLDTIVTEMTFFLQSIFVSVFVNPLQINAVSLDTFLTLVALVFCYFRNNGFRFFDSHFSHICNKQIGTEKCIGYPRDLYTEAKQQLML